MVGILKNSNGPPPHLDAGEDIRVGKDQNPVKVGVTIEENTESSTEGPADASNEKEVTTSDEEPVKKERPQMKARFGSVRVAWHRMTLGSAHPGGTGGIPVTLGELEDAERYETVENFSQKFHYDKKNSIVIRKPKQKLERLTESTRRNLVLEHHTAEELAAIEKEVTEVVGERKESSHKAKVQAFLDYKKKQQEEMEKKRIEEKAKKGGLFSCFGR